MALKHFEGIPVGQQQLFTLNAQGEPVPVGPDNPILTKLMGSNVAEQKTQADAVTGTVTFSKPINVIQIYNVDETNTGVFNINGIAITVPPGKPFKASIGGTPRSTITVTGSTSYILTRYE